MGGRPRDDANYTAWDEGGRERSVVQELRWGGEERVRERERGREGDALPLPFEATGILIDP